MLNTRRSSWAALLLLSALAVSCGDDSGAAGAKPDAQVAIDVGHATTILDGGLDAQVSVAQPGVALDAGSSACPGEYQCQSPTGLFLCTKASGEILTCDKQADCPFGSCYPYAGQGICLLQCTPPQGLPTQNTITGTVVALTPGKGQTGTSETPQEPPLAGVQVCVASPASLMKSVGCTTTAADGTFTLSHVPPNRNAANPVPIALTFIKDGYVSEMLGLVLFDGSQAISNDVRLLTVEYAGKIAAQAGGKLPDTTTGWLQTEAVQFNPKGPDTAATYYNGTLKLRTVDGVVISSNPDAGVGPVYLDDSEQPTALAGGLDAGTATSGAGQAYFVGAPAGTYQVTFKHPSLTCGDAPTAATVVPGFLFVDITAICGNGVAK